MADFGRGVKAGIVAGIIYMVIPAVLGAIYSNSFYVPHFIQFLYAAGLTPLFSLAALTDPSSVISFLFQYIVRGVVFGVIFAALYGVLPGTASVKKGVVLSAFVWILSAVWLFYMTPGWPIEGWTYCGGGAVVLSSIWLALAGIISTLAFGALTGFLWDRFRGKKVAEAKKASPALLLSFILGALIWAYFAALYLTAVVTSGLPALDPDLWWDELLGMSVVFLGLPGFVLADVAWRRAKRSESGLKWGVAAGVLMVLTGIMLLPGVLAVIGGVLSGRQPVGEPSTAAIGAIVEDKIARAGEQKRRTNINRSLILLIASMIMLTITVIVGFTTSTSPTSIPIEIRTWYDLNATRDTLGGSYLLMNNLDSTTPGYEELASETANQGKGWQPIGAFINQQVGHGVLGFEGTFDGQGYEIRDLFINRPDEVAVGLFLGVGQKGVIKDVGVVNATVTGDTFVGTLVGWNHGAVRDSYFIGSVTANYFVGGLAGLNVGSVLNSYSTGSVTGNGGVGGLIAQNFGNVSNSYSSANVTGTAGVGGLVGSGGGTVSNCYATSSVNGSSSVGGLMGGNSGAVLNSYSTGSVTGNSSVGGLVGDTFEGTVSNSYSTASVTGNSSVGGLVGENVRSTVSNSFWDIQTSGQATSDGGTGKTTAEMKSMATFSGAGWNITAVANPGMSNPSSIWNIVDDVTYPFLSWQSVG